MGKVVLDFSFFLVSVGMAFLRKSDKEKKNMELVWSGSGKVDNTKTKEIENRSEENVKKWAVLVSRSVSNYLELR